MPPDADAATIRNAYRRRAREHHPDQRGGASADEMAAINEAYRVLGDAARRVQYDRSLSSARGGVSTDSSRREPAPSSTGPVLPVTPARFPWRLVGGMAAVGVAVVLIGAIFAEPAAERAPDGILRSGSCVTIEANGDAREVTCRGEGDLVVDQLIPIDATCPGGTEPHRDRLGLGTACVVVAAGT